MVVLSQPASDLLGPRESRRKEETEEEALRLQDPSNLFKGCGFVGNVFQNPNTQQNIEGRGVIGQDVFMFRAVSLGFQTL